jgi:oligopeptide/dipeptide ABC transporter, ATP-binding protein, C-terminal domain
VAKRAGREQNSQTPLLSVRGLRTTFVTDDGIVPAVDGVSFTIDRGTTVGLVGESGCGKSVTSLSIMKLIPSPPGKVEAEEILFDGKDLSRMSEREMRRIRGNEIAMVFQEPMTSLNPVFKIGDQIMEAIILHQKVSKREARERAIELLRMVGIPSPDKRVDEYPHHLSGGMRQRVVIAIALSCNPKLLIADEPTTALDVTIQAQILDLLRRLQEELGMAILLITHDLGVVAEMCQRVIVMYAGKIVEEGPVVPLFQEPAHPYTRGLLASIPKMNEDRPRLTAIPGVVPHPARMPSGCRFHPRCQFAKPICEQLEPPRLPVGEGRFAACWMHTDFEPLEAVPGEVSSSAGRS